MPVIKKLSPEEVEKLFEPVQRVDLGLYTQTLERMDVGEWGVVRPEGNETMRLIKRRLNLAARKLGVRVRYKERPESAPGMAFAKKPLRA